MRKFYALTLATLLAAMVTGAAPASASASENPAAEQIAVVDTATTTEEVIPTDEPSEAPPVPLAETLVATPHAIPPTEPGAQPEPQSAPDVAAAPVPESASVPEPNSPAAAVPASSPAPLKTSTLECDSSPTWDYGWKLPTTFWMTLEVDADSSGTCDEVTFQASSYRVPSTWARDGFSSSAVPQQAIQHSPITFPARSTSTAERKVTLAVPECGPYQVDLYTGAVVDRVDQTGHGSTFLSGGLVDGPNCPPAAPVTPVAPQLTVGTCLAVGAVVLPPDTTDYTWSITGPANATTYTAVAAANTTLTGTQSWTYDLTKVTYNDPACHPSFVVATQCGSVSITYVNSSGWTRYPDYRIGDEQASGNWGSGPVYHVVKVLAGETKSIYSHVWAEDFGGGSVRVAYQDILGAERDIDTPSKTVVVSTDCVAAVPVPPQVGLPVATPVPPACEAAGSLTLAPDEDFTWSEPLVYGPGTHTVTATANPGYVFQQHAGYTVTTNGTIASFPVTVLPAIAPQSIDSAAPCFVAPEVPAIVPLITVPAVPVVNPIPAVSTSKVSAVPTQVATIRAPALASTGMVGLPWLLLTAAGLVGSGSLVLIRVRRARRLAS